LPISNTDHEQYVFDIQEFTDDVGFGFTLPNNVSKRKSKSHNDKYIHQWRVEECIFQGIEDLSNANENENLVQAENVDLYSHVWWWEGWVDNRIRTTTFSLPLIA